MDERKTVTALMCPHCASICSLPAEGKPKIYCCCSGEAVEMMPQTLIIYPPGSVIVDGERLRGLAERGYCPPDDAAACDNNCPRCWLAYLTGSDAVHPGDVLERFPNGKPAVTALPDGPVPE